MSIQELNQNELNEVSGGAFTVTGPGIDVSLDPFVTVGTLLGGVIGLTSVVGAVTDLVDLGGVTGLLGDIL